LNDGRAEISNMDEIVEYLMFAPAPAADAADHEAPSLSRPPTPAATPDPAPVASRGRDGANPHALQTLLGRLGVLSALLRLSGR
jgi:hypothetical protein